MPLVVELTVDKDINSLSNIFRGVIINSENKNVNKSTREIIKNDLVKYKPQHLVHCYSLKEMVKLVELFQEQKYVIKVSREIIPNNYNLGILREMYLTGVSIRESNIFSKRYRYYLIMTKDNGGIVLTYNPQLNSIEKLQQSKITFGENVAYCQILQTVETVRELTKEKEVKDVVGVYSIYNI